MDDKELLKLAAKAAGIGVRWHEIWEQFVHIGEWFEGRPLMHKHEMIWNPIFSDGDALRLAVKLGMEITIFLSSQRTEVYQLGTTGESPSEDHKQDSYAATRRAIVRAAAEIGKSK